MLKNFARKVIRSCVFSAPWGIRETLLDACIDRIGPREVGSRVIKKLNLVEVEVGARGTHGIVHSSWGDTGVLPEYAVTGTFAKAVIAEIMAFFAGFPEGGTFIDIGANIGLTTIPLAQNPRIHCLAFEPEPTNFNFLKRNVTRNAPHGDVELHQIALWHSRNVMSLAVADGNIGDHRLTEGRVGERRIVDVQALPLDDFLHAVTGPLAIKMDTQGAEPHIIAGGHKTFARADLVAIEFCPFLMRQLRGNSEVILDYLTSFEHVAIMPGGSMVEPQYGPAADALTTLKQKLRGAIDSDSDYLDILAKRHVPVRFPESERILSG